MEGITVLTEATGLTIWSTLLYILVIFLSGLIGILILCTVGSLIEEHSKLSDSAIKSISIIVLISTIIWFSSTVTLFGRYIAEKNRSYKVTIDDSVSFNEFNAKYKVLKQDGEIFTVVEREVKENE